jgi:hypothetical protein
MSRILYLIDLFSQIVYSPINASTPNTFQRNYNIYYFDITKDLTSYWVTTWNGFFDTPNSTELQIFFNEFLVEVFTQDALENNVGVFYVDGNFIYLNLELKPWQYFKKLTSLYDAEDGRFSTAQADPNNPSDWKFSGSNNDYKPYFLVPSINNKISSPLSDISLQQQFSFSIINNDGNLDNIEDKNYYNVPVSIRKAIEDIPTISDFSTIHRGLVESVSLTLNSISVNSVDYNKLLTSEVTGFFNSIDYPNLPNEQESKPIPIGYGPLNKVPLILVEDGGSFFDYVAIEPSQITSVSIVYDSDGNSISFTETGGIIRTTTEAASADINGKINNKIGEIIIELIDSYSIFKFNSSNWDLTESNNYVSISKSIGFYFASGNLKTAINKILKNDNAFLIQKNDGRFTLRQWGQVYSQHNIDYWTLVNENSLKKNTVFAAKYYQSSARVNYNKIEITNIFNNTFLYEEDELNNFGEFKRSKIVNYDTSLLNEIDAADLGKRTTDRFGRMNPDIIIETGKNTSAINLLDTVLLEININGRLFTETYGFIVREINPAQDRILLESISGFNVELATLDENELAILDENELAIMEV